MALRKDVPHAGESSALIKKAKWHEDRAGTGHASMERAGQYRYRGELMKSPNAGIPDAPLAQTPRRIAGRRVEPEFKPRTSRPKPEDFAWR